MIGFKWEDRYELFDSLGETQLLHIARNEAAPVENRLFAVEVMLKRGYQSAKHVDLRGLVTQLDVDIQAISVPEIDPEPESFGAPSASVTTATMAEPVQKMDRKQKTPKIVPVEAEIENK